MIFKYAQIMLLISNKEMDRTFTYKIPNQMQEIIERGMRVIVPFGRNNKNYEGFILNLTNEIDISEKNIKSILYLPDNYPMLNNDILELIVWMKHKYYTTMAECLKCVIPAGVEIKSEFIYKINDENQIYNLTNNQQNIYNFILKNKDVTKNTIINFFGDSGFNTLNNMVKKGIVTKIQISKSKNSIQKEKYVYLTDSYKKNLTNDNQKKIVELLLKHKKLPVKSVKSILNISDSSIKTLEKRGIVEIVYEEFKRNPINFSNFNYDSEKVLNIEQKSALESILNEYKSNIKKPILLHGITGSGKTEVYLQFIDYLLKQGKQAIVLVPEIALTSQTVEKFINRFGNKVMITHSRLSNGERYDQWRNALEGNISIMIGPRSAVFTPFKNLGTIIIDEEHENSYKSDTTPKYDTREVAIKRCKINNGIVILGSATPSVNSYFKCKENIYKMVVLKERINKTLPIINIVDMRLELANGNMSIFSRGLKNALEKNLINNQQTILFLNRRGYANFVSCRKCGSVMQCDNCNVSYTYHMFSDSLMCHYCGKTVPNPTNCPVCGSKYIKQFGVGTQRVESEIKKLFPRARVLRMDLDTTSKKNSHELILSKFRAEEADILIGTQMIAKGLDFPNVTLVGIIAADVSLNLGDYRSGEITYQLLTQVSGRAGRADKEGIVFIQTYNPNHYSIECVKDNNYNKFYNYEIALRRQMFYPPFSNMFLILFTSENEENTEEAIFKLEEIMNFYNKKNYFEFLGPSPAIISKIQNKYRWKIIVKGQDEELLKKFVLHCIFKFKKLKIANNININISLNPSNNI